MARYAKELYVCLCGCKAMKQVDVTMVSYGSLGMGGFRCPKCGTIFNGEHFQKAYACDEDGRITE